jgi:nucleoid DNA-binding protein
MNKNELVAAVADSAKLSKGDAQAAVDAVFSCDYSRIEERWRRRQTGGIRQFLQFQSALHQLAAIRKPAPK